MSNTKIEMIKVTDLKPYEKNQRIHPKDQVELVVKSIKQYGFLVPVVIDKNNEVIAGHGRLMALDQCPEIKEVPCIRADHLTEEQVKAFRLADNRITEMSTWDFDLLPIELDELSEAGMNLDDIGFGDTFMLQFGLGDVGAGDGSDGFEMDDDLPDVNITGQAPNKSEYLVIRFPDEDEFHELREALGLKGTVRAMDYEDFKEAWKKIE